MPRSDEDLPGTKNAPIDKNAAHPRDPRPTQSLSEQCARIHDKVYQLLRREPRTDRVREVQRQTRISLGVIAQSLERYRLDELSFSYNGGKDCLVLLILFLTALHSYAIGEQPPSVESNHNPDGEPPAPAARLRNALPPTLPSVYIVSRNPFPAVTTFVADSSAAYHLSLARYHKPMKEAFASYLADFPGIKAIFVGTRRTDPHGARLTHFDPTTDDWPDFVRVHPVIDWHYADIWAFIRELNVEYCELYDQGYTSLGGTNDTHPNPALAVQQHQQQPGQEGSKAEGSVQYRPAYELIDDYEERLGRDR